MTSASGCMLRSLRSNALASSLLCGRMQVAGAASGNTGRLSPVSVAWPDVTGEFKAQMEHTEMQHADLPAPSRFGPS